MECYQWREEGGIMGDKVQGIRSIIDRYKIGGDKNNIGDGEAKELYTYDPWT